MTRFNQFNARSAALSLSIAALALVVTTNAGQAQTAQNKVLKLDSGKIASRQIVVERAKGNIGGGKIQPKFLPPKAETAKNPNAGNGGGGTGTVFFVPPKAAPANKPNNPPVTAQFVPPKAEPVKTGGNGGGGTQVLRLEVPKSPRVSAEPKVKVVSNTPAAQVALAPEAIPAPAAPTPEAKVEAVPAPKAVVQQKVVVTVPQGYYYAPRAYSYGGYVPTQRYYGSYGGGSGSSNCRR